MAARPQARREGLSPVDLLAGRWTVRRQLHDHRLDRHGAFEGVADFTPDGDGLRWGERGHMTLGGFGGATRRDLRIAPGPDGWEVRFSDGRLFHALDLSTGSCDAHHPCGADVYRGRYVLETPDRLTVDWRVTGPEADETLLGVYRRSAASSAGSRACARRP